MAQEKVHINSTNALVVPASKSPSKKSPAKRKNSKLSQSMKRVWSERRAKQQTARNSRKKRITAKAIVLKTKPESPSQKRKHIINQIKTRLASIQDSAMILTSSSADVPTNGELEAALLEDTIQIWRHLQEIKDIDSPNKGGTVHQIKWSQN